MAEIRTAQGPARRQQLLRRSIAILSPLLFAAIAWFGVRNFDSALAQADAHVVALNALPYFLLFLAFWWLSQRTLFALTAGSMVLGAFHFAHFAKLEHLTMPLVPDDLLMLPQVLGHWDFFLHYGPSPWIVAGLLAVFIAALVLEPRSLRWRWPAWLVANGAMFACLASLWLGWQPWPRLYESASTRFELWEPRKSAVASGATAFFVRLAWVSTLSYPQPDKVRLDDLRGKLIEAKPLAARATLPDIVVIQSESLFDPGRLNGIDSTAYLPNLHTLSSQAIHGDMHVPTFGGGTTETEFEVLTGISLNPLPNIDYPFQSVVHETTQSLVRGLFGLGYSTVAIHPYHANFYLRDTVYPKLGFERFLTQDDFDGSDRHAYYVSDEALTDRILAELDAPGDAPRFIFAVSMENHGPWGPKRAATYEEPPPPADVPGLDPALALQLGQYMHHVQRSDAALGRLVQRLRERERPTILLFYGDHLPGLKPVFASVGFRDGNNGSSQPVPFLLLDVQQPSEERLTIRSSELPGLLLEIAGIDLGPNFRDLARMVRSPDMNDSDRDQFRRDLSLTVLNDTRQPDAEAEADFRLIEVTPTTLGVPQDDRPIQTRLRARGLKPGAQLFLSGKPLQTHRFGMRAEAQIPARLLKDIGVGNQARLEVLFDGDERHDVTEWTLVSGDEIPENGYCPVTAWGPDVTEAGIPSNPQPDGSQGVWIRIFCYPSDARVMFDGTELDTYYEPGLITARLPRDAILRPGEYRLSLKARVGRVELGKIRVTPATSTP